jgi:hypothetical protein
LVRRAEAQFRGRRPDRFHDPTRHEPERDAAGTDDGHAAMLFIADLQDLFVAELLGT